MSVAYRSWEVARGHFVGYSMAFQTNVCATADTIHESPNYSSNTILSPEAFVQAVAAGADVSKGITFPTHKTLAPQDSVIRGLSSLSLHPQSLLQVASPSENSETSSSCESSDKPLESNCCDPLARNGKNIFPFRACSAGYYTQGEGSGSQKSLHCDGSGFEDVSCGGSTSLPHSGSSEMQESFSPNTFWEATRSYFPSYDNYRDVEFYDFPKRTLDVVVEDKSFEESVALTESDDLGLDAFSESSTNSVSSSALSPVDGSVSYNEGLFGAGESEAQNAPSTFSGVSSPPRKGLSRFYAGKSRSFGCLGDVMSLRDLAKPENPCAKKRRCNTGSSLNSGRPQLPPLQKGVTSICKKSVHIGKSTLGLAVMMSSRDDGLENGSDQGVLGAQQSSQKGSLSSRSFSLSDLHRATERRVSLC